MNKKGYTLIEVLAAVVIMGILLTVAVVAVTKYSSSTKESAYEIMAKSALEATEDYIADNDAKENNNYSFDELKNGGYLDNTNDPDKKDTPCDGKVIYNEDNSTIYLYCSNRNLKYIYSNGKLGEATDLVTSYKEKIGNLEQLSIKGSPAYLYIATNYSFDKSTGEYTLSANFRRITNYELYNLVKSGETIYSFNKDSNNKTDNTMYRIYSLVTNEYYENYNVFKFTSEKVVE